MNYTIIKSNWHEHRDYLSQIRRRVFIEEQGVPEELEWDEFDDSSYHFIALADKGTPMACGRLKPDGQIGRMAVDKQWRNKGIGTAILDKILQQARILNINKLYLHAQVTAIPFYEKHGFSVTGEIYDEAGIAHRSMTLSLE